MNVENTLRIMCSAIIQVLNCTVQTSSGCVRVAVLET